MGKKCFQRYGVTEITALLQKDRESVPGALCTQTTLTCISRFLLTFHVWALGEWWKTVVLVQKGTEGNCAVVATVLCLYIYLYVYIYII